MTIAVMQPYFLPYIGYFQLLNAADRFVIYDDVEFTKKGWIHRNRILVNGQPNYFTLPLKKDSDYLNVVDRSLSGDFPLERDKMLRRVVSAYRKATFFFETFPLFEEIIGTSETNLFRFIHASVEKVKSHLEIATPIEISSTLPVEPGLRREHKLWSFCRYLGADRYLNPIGGQALYSKDSFSAQGIQLSFLETSVEPYKQYENEFVPHLSILDVLMFNGKYKTRQMLTQYRLI